MGKKLTREQLVEKFQCPGCVCGSDTKCGAFRPEDQYKPGVAVACRGHVPGTSLLGGPKIVLGMPKGFNRIAPDDGTFHLRIFDNGKPDYNRWNVPVWHWLGRGEYEGFLFVRCFSPRVGAAYVDVIKGGTVDDVAGSTNIESLLAEMD